VLPKGADENDVERKMEWPRGEQADNLKITAMLGRYGRSRGGSCTRFGLEGNCPVPAGAGMAQRGAMADDFALALAGLLRQLRKRMGLTQEELAERASLSVRSVSDTRDHPDRSARKCPAAG